jgi:uncharacterized protein (DUF1778 family)
MSVASANSEKLPEVEVTAEQQRLIAKAAEREQRSVSSFVLNAVLKAAQSPEKPRRRYTQEEVDGVIERAQEAMRRANPTGRSIVDELIAERREASKYE